MEQEILNSFDQLLGKVFYCSAMADRVIKEEEVARLNELITEHWEEEGELIMDTFFRCINFGYDPSHLPGEIKAHKTVDPELFSKVMIERIMKTAYAITNATSGTNKSEVVFISQLRMELER